MVEIRPAATVLLVRDDPFEVLMVERHHTTFFASALVFPGGLVSPDDRSDDWLPYLAGAEGLDPLERGLRIAAVRETFEETGLLLSEQLGAGPVPANPEQPFFELVRELGVRLEMQHIRKIGHWVTPDVSPKRFDTHFYVARAPAGQQPVCDGGETVSLEWIAPARAVALAEAREREILFPTRMNLKRLAESASCAEALAAASSPPFTVCPLVERTDAGICIRIPAEAGYGVTEDWPPPSHFPK